MPIVTIALGGLLIALGVVGYVMSDMASLTALIPAAFGVILDTLGALALIPRFRKTAMHIAVAVALLGFLGSMRGLASLGVMLGGGNVQRPMAVLAQTAMGVLTGIYVLLAVRSFLVARRQRESTPQS